MTTKRFRSVSEFRRWSGVESQARVYNTSNKISLLCRDERDLSQRHCAIICPTYLWLDKNKKFCSRRHWFCARARAPVQLNRTARPVDCATPFFQCLSRNPKKVFERSPEIIYMVCTRNRNCQKSTARYEGVFVRANVGPGGPRLGDAEIHESWR